MNNFPKAPDDWFNRKIAEGNGIFDRKSFDLMMSACDKFDTAIDVGAHVGTWSIGMASKFKTVYSFEPNMTNYNFLVTNTNDYKNIKSNKLAVGNKDFVQKLIKNGISNSGQSHIQESDTDENDNCIKGSYCSATTITIDTFLITDESSIDLLKIDVEGYELFALMGAKETILKHKPVISIELNGLGMRYGITDKQIIDYIESSGYTLFGKNNKDYVFKGKK